MSATSAWTEVLAGCEERILACRTLLDGDLDATTAAYLRDLSAGEEVETPATLVRFVPPEDLGPIPAELIPRARALLESGAAVEVELAARRDDVMTRLRSLSTRPSAYGAGHEAPRPQVIDQHG